MAYADYYVVNFKHSISPIKIEHIGDACFSRPILDRAVFSYMLYNSYS